jgi:hypothetical protein
VSLGEESIVVDQHEWLTDLTTFHRLLGAHNIVPVREWHLTDTANLPRPSRLLSAMYTAVVYERRPEAAPRAEVAAPEESVPQEVAPQVEAKEDRPSELGDDGPQEPVEAAESFIDLLDQL